MASVMCPACGGKGSLPDHLLGKKIRCQKCGTTFEAGLPLAGSTNPGASASASTTPGTAQGHAIEVDGLDASTWTATAVAVAEVDHDLHESPAEPHQEEATAAFTASPISPSQVGDAPIRQYKVLTQKDRWFEGKYELFRLEEALNYYARQGWVVRAMATPHVTGFSGGIREELVVLLER